MNDDAFDAVIQEELQKADEDIPQYEQFNQWDPTKFSRARHVIEWATSSQFLGKDTLYDYPREYQILRDIDELLCPGCNNGKYSDVSDCWNRSKWDMQHDVLFEFGVCPKCKKDRNYYRLRGDIEEIEEVINILGMRSGKSFMIGSLKSTYIAHRYMCLKDPCKYFRIDRSTMLEAGFFASSKEQSRETIWGYFYNTLLSSEWYLAYIADLKKFSEKYKIPWDDTYKQLTTYLRITPQNLQWTSYHSNPATTAGRTRFEVVVDEMGMFDTVNADEIHSIPNASLRTLFSAADLNRQNGDPDVPPVQMIQIGSPGKDPSKDPLEHRYQATTTVPINRVYALRLATWEANPFITRESLDNEFITDPIKAQQQWGAKAVSQGVKFFGDHPDLLINSAFFPTEPVGVEWSPLVRPANNAGKILYYTQMTVQNIRLGLQHKEGVILIGDAGKTRDRFTVAVIRVIGTGSTMITRLESIIQMIPGVVDTREGKQPTEIFYPCILELVSKLKLCCPVRLVVFDRWDSTMLIQQIREMGIPAIQENTVPEDYRLARGELLGNRVHIPCGCPPYMSYAYTNLKHEIETLNQDANGKVDHPLGGHNDLVQVLCKGISVALTLGETLKKARKESGILTPIEGMKGPRIGKFSHGLNRVPQGGDQSTSMGMPPARLFSPGRRGR